MSEPIRTDQLTLNISTSGVGAENDHQITMYLPPPPVFSDHPKALHHKKRRRLHFSHFCHETSFESHTSHILKMLKKRLTL